MIAAALNSKKLMPFLTKRVRCSGALSSICSRVEIPAKAGATRGAAAPCPALVAKQRNVRPRLRRVGLGARPFRTARRRDWNGDAVMKPSRRSEMDGSLGTSASGSSRQFRRAQINRRSLFLAVTLAFSARCRDRRIRSSFRCNRGRVRRVCGFFLRYPSRRASR